MVVRRSRNVVLQVRWPFRVIDFPGGGFQIRRPWWGRPIHAIARWFGVHLVTLHLAHPPISRRFYVRSNCPKVTIR